MIIEKTKRPKRLVILESPFKGYVERNVEYARRCVRDSIMRGEAPLASHLLYTQYGILNDDNEEERNIGLQLGLMWYEKADLCVVYVDFGITEGMNRGIYTAHFHRVPVAYRTIL